MFESSVRLGGSVVALGECRMARHVRAARPHRPGAHSSVSAASTWQVLSDSANAAIFLPVYARVAEKRGIDPLACM